MSAEFIRGLEAAAKLADRRAALQIECERLGFPCPETGISECHLEARGRDCLCQERIEEAEEIARLIRAVADGATP